MRPLPDKAPHATAILNVDRWVAVARPRGETLGAISLLDSGKPATGVDLFELEQAAMVLGWELLHNRSIAEAELALWDDFTTESLEDSDVERVRSMPEGSATTSTKLTAPCWCCSLGQSQGTCARRFAELQHARVPIAS